MSYNILMEKIYFFWYFITCYFRIKTNILILCCIICSNFANNFTTKSSNSRLNFSMLHFLIVTPDVVLMMFSLTGTIGSGSKVVQGRKLPSAPQKKKKYIYIYISCPSRKTYKNIFDPPQTSLALPQLIVRVMLRIC